MLLLVAGDDGQVSMGKPTVAGCVVKAEFLAEVKEKKSLR